MVLLLRGELDAASVPHLDAALAVVPPAAALVVDMAALSFIDSSGLNSLVKAVRHRGQLTIRNPRPHTRRVLEITGLHKVADIID